MEPYPNPPIREALIDIKIDPLPPSRLPILESQWDKIKEQYPLKKTRHRWEGAVEFQKEGSISAGQRHLGPDGFLFTSSDGQEIVQNRLDGFTFNRLRPYPREGWPRVREKASWLWELYLNAVQPTRVIGIVLRYINEINIPSVPVQLEDYLTEPPRIPESLPQTLEHFLTRIVIPLPEFGDMNAKAIITQALAQPSTPNTTSLILDINILTETSMPADTAAVWQVLDRFRIVKNMIFKASIRPKTEELFQ